MTGCDRVSPGCDNCYALNLAKRLKAMGQKRYQNDGDPRTSGPGFALTLQEDMLEAPLRWHKPRTVFVNSMSDLFHKDVPTEFIQRVFEVMGATPQHTYQILTKRSKRLKEMDSALRWAANIWMGVSVESDRYVFRAADLVQTGARIKFLSLEPLLAPIPSLNLDGIDWVIAGGESGSNARPIEAGWVRDIRDLCESTDTEFFFKQWGGRTSKSNGRVLDGMVYDGMPARGLPADGPGGRLVMNTGALSPS